MNQFSRRAMSILEVVVIVACAAVLLCLFLANLAPRHTHGGRRTKDATQIRGIHQSWVVYAKDFNGIFPTPGLERRLPFNGTTMPGRGEEDRTQNTTANLYSMCIMGNYFSPEMCIGPTEPSSRVVTHEDDYNYEAYSPIHGVHWDAKFEADLHKTSNVSYAHMPLFGEMKLKHWRDTLDASHPIIGNRGPLGGVHDPNSITNKIHSPHSRWSGFIIPSDNSVNFTETFPTRPRAATIEYTIAPECLPNNRQPPSTDAVITFTKHMRGSIPVVQHD